jgi:hypothetical protein
MNLDYDQYFKPFYDQKIKTNPVIILITGDNYNQNKFNVMLNIYRHLVKSGLKSSVISHRSIGCFFNFHQITPQFYSHSRWLFFIKSFMAEYQSRLKSDIILLSLEGPYQNNLQVHTILSLFPDLISILVSNQSETDYLNQLSVIYKTMNRKHSLPDMILINSAQSIENSELLNHKMIPSPYNIHDSGSYLKKICELIKKQLK